MPVAKDSGKQALSKKRKLKLWEQMALKPQGPEPKTRELQ